MHVFLNLYHVTLIRLSHKKRVSLAQWKLSKFFIGNYYILSICMPFIDWSFKKRARGRQLAAGKVQGGVSSSFSLRSPTPLPLRCTQRHVHREREKETRLNFQSIGSTRETVLPCFALLSYWCLGSGSWNNSTGSTVVTIHHSSFLFYILLFHRLLRLFIDWSFIYCSCLHK